MGQPVSSLPAQAAAVAYRKNPADQSNATHVDNFAHAIAQRKAAYDQDSHDFGEAWGEVRQFITGPPGIEGDA